MNIKEFGVKGDGITDDSLGIQKALDNKGLVEIPCGEYLIMNPLKIHSDTEIKADANARIILGNNVLKTKDDFLLSNSDKEHGNSNIIIDGGIWEGNCLNNIRSKDLFNGKTASGAMFNFFNIKKMTFKNMVLKNLECYYTRFCKAEDVIVYNISFESEHIRANQDGIHLAGYCKNFKISKLKGTYGSPNDDFVALNADDCMERIQNLGLLRGPIENVEIEDLYSPRCLSFIRMLSVEAPIRNINVKKIRGNCKVNLINIDASKYCRTPLVSKDEERYFSGVGCIENVHIDDVVINNIIASRALLLVESNLNNFVIENYRNKSKISISPFLLIRNVGSTSIELELENGQKINKQSVNKYKINTKSIKYLKFSKA